MSGAWRPGGNKYAAIKTEYNGMKFASKSEAARAAQLDLLTRAGKIRGWCRQVPFMLGCPEAVYRCDFLVFNLDGSVEAEDVKGMSTPKFLRDVKLWRRYGMCPLNIIKGGKVSEVIMPNGGETLRN